MVKLHWLDGIAAMLGLKGFNFTVRKENIPSQGMKVKLFNTGSSRMVESTWKMDIL